MDQIATLPATPPLRREQIRLQVALIAPLIHTEGHAAPETRAAGEQAHRLIKQAEAFGVAPEDPLQLFSPLSGIFVANFVASDVAEARRLSAEFLAFAEKQGATVPLMVGHRIVWTSLLIYGDIAAPLPHYDQALALYNPATHRRLAIQFVHDARVAVLAFRAWVRWALGFPDATLAYANHALEYAREIGHAATMMFALLTHYTYRCFAGS
jgi:hypothetical protein